MVKSYDVNVPRRPLRSSSVKDSHPSSKCLNHLQIAVFWGSIPIGIRHIFYNFNPGKSNFDLIAARCSTFIVEPLYQKHGSNMKMTPYNLNDVINVVLN